jgi:hypothetical protein
MRGQRLHVQPLPVVVLVAAAAAAAALAAVPDAGASNPQVQHFTFAPPVDTDDDFCDTGKTVTDAFTGRLTVWSDPNQPVDARRKFVAEEVFNSPSTGVTVVTHTAFSFTDTLTAGDPNGVNTHEWTFKGAAQITRVVGGGVVIADHGYLVVDTTWAGPEFDSELLDIQVVRDAGGHPNFGGDFCAAMVPALGLG